jgi:hypothetical protein
LAISLSFPRIRPACGDYTKYFTPFRIDDHEQTARHPSEQPVALFAVFPAIVGHDRSVRIRECGSDIGEAEPARLQANIALRLIPLKTDLIRIAGASGCFQSGLPLGLFAQHLVGPFHQGHQIRRRYEPGILAVEIAVADRTGP